MSRALRSTAVSSRVLVSGRMAHTRRGVNGACHLTVCRYKEGTLSVGENSCIDRCCAKYWQVREGGGRKGAGHQGLPVYPRAASKQWSQFPLAQTMMSSLPSAMCCSPPAFRVPLRSTQVVAIVGQLLGAQNK